MATSERGVPRGNSPPLPTAVTLTPGIAITETALSYRRDRGKATTKVTTDQWIWLSLAALGLFHGLNPAMGWLFAVALALQERRLTAIFRALVPIAVGHMAAIALFAGAVILLGWALPRSIVAIVAGLLLLSFAAWRALTRFRHPRTRFRARARELAVWSFLMANAHGAGLMVAPLLAALGHPVTDQAHASHMADFGLPIGAATLAVLVHTGAMWLTMMAVSLLVYRELGIEIVQRTWINVDRLWIATLVIAGLLSLGIGLWHTRPLAP